MANNRIYKKEVIEVYSAVDFKIFYDKIFSESLIRKSTPSIPLVYSQYTKSILPVYFLK